MARQFASGSSQYLASSATPITAAPFTMACWFQYSTDAGNVLMALGNSGGTEQYIVYVNASGADTLGCYRVGVGGSDLTSVGTPTKNIWHHAVLVVTAIDDIDLYYNSSGQNDTTSIGIANWDRVTIGCEADSGLGTYLTGMMAEVAIWNAALTQSEIDILFDKYTPPMVRPQNLVFYVPLVRDNDEDIVGGLSLAASGSPTVATHPPIIYPAPPIFYSIPSAPPADALPMAMNHYRRLRT